MVRAATDAAVRASISTPVLAVVAAEAVMTTPLSVTVVITSMNVSGSGWHIGISSDVFLAAWMPATRATSRGFPLGFCGRAFRTFFDRATKAEAVASRRVAGLALTSTMRARPALSLGGRLGISGEGTRA